MRTYKVLSYSRTADKRFTVIKMYTKFAEIEETTSFLWYKKVRTFKIYKNSMYWKYLDSGKFVHDDLDSFMDSYGVLHEYK